jgi:large subunit ribosomal protein L22
MEVRAYHKWVRLSPSKVRRYCRVIQGLPVQEAVRLLEVETSPSAFELLRTLRSATANAENNHDLEAEDLVVKQAVATDALKMRRLLPRARGRADMVRKRSCHILVVVGESEEALARAREQRSKAAGAGPRRLGGPRPAKRAAPPAHRTARRR